MMELLLTAAFAWVARGPASPKVYLPGLPIQAPFLRLGGTILLPIARAEEIALKVFYLKEEDDGLPF